VRAVPVEPGESPGLASWTVTHEISTTQDPETAAFCKKEGIQMQAFAPVARGQKKDDPDLHTITKEVGRGWNQVIPLSLPVSC